MSPQSVPSSSAKMCSMRMSLRGCRSGCRRRVEIGSLTSERFPKYLDIWIARLHEEVMYTHVEKPCHVQARTWTRTLFVRLSSFSSSLHARNRLLEPNFD